MRRARAVRLAAACLLLAALGAGAHLVGLLPGTRGRYRNSDLDLVTAYRAKDACSCLFVLRRDEAYCRAWTTANPDVASLEVDPERRAVTSRALLLWRARARWVNEREGCVLE